MDSVAIIPSEKAANTAAKRIGNRIFSWLESWIDVLSLRGRPAMFRGERGLLRNMLLLWLVEGEECRWEQNKEVGFCNYYMHSCGSPAQALVSLVLNSPSSLTLE